MNKARSHRKRPLAAWIR